MKRAVKRPIRVYLYHGLWILVTLFYATRNSSDFGRLILGLMACISTVSLVSLIMKRNYFEIKDDLLVINREFFRTRRIELDKIEKFNSEPGPFVSSKIILKDKTKVRYNDSQVDEMDLKEVMKQFNIPVE